MNSAKNIFTVDLEDWYHSYYSGRSIKTNKYRVVAPTEKILRLLKKTNNFATFFVVGDIARKHPQLIKKIVSEGHEIACHSNNHQFIYNMTEKQFEKDLIRAIKKLESITHKKVLGYRAPAWSVDKIKTPWFWKILKKHGITYSSSIFPFKTFMYGDNYAKRFKHSINSVIEIPPSTSVIFNKRIPFSGGFYLRCIPVYIILFLTYLINKHNQPVIFYIHPREIDTKQPRLKLPLKESFIHYYGIGGTYKKLKKILHTFKVTSVQKFYDL